MSLTTHSKIDNLFQSLRRSVEPKPRPSALVWASAQTTFKTSPDLSLGFFLDQGQRAEYNGSRRAYQVKRVKRTRSGSQTNTRARLQPKRLSTTNIPLRSKSTSKKEIKNAAVRLQLFEAIRRNDQDRVIEIVREAEMRREGGGSACINDADRMGTVPLMVVASSDHGSVSAGAMLLRLGALHNKSSLVTGESSIHLAAQRGHCEFLSMLLKRRDKSGQFADVNLRTTTGLTALMLAARNGHARAVDILLNKSADKTMMDSNGMKAIDHASSFPDVVRQLVFGTRVDQSSGQDEYVRLPMWHVPNHTSDEGSTQAKTQPTLLVFNSCARGWRSHTLTQ